MLPNVLLRSLRTENSSREKKTANLYKTRSGCDREVLEEEEWQQNQNVYSVPFHHKDRPIKPTKFSLRSHNRNNGGTINKKSMASNFSDLIQRVTASCLLHPLTRPNHNDDDDNDDESPPSDFKINSPIITYEDNSEDEKSDQSEQQHDEHEPLLEMEMLISQVFDAVSTMKKAYVSLQEAHSPWDPDKMRVSDVAVVAELRRLGLLRERWRRSGGGGGGGRRWRVAVREVVAPYEAAVEDLKREVKVKEAEVQDLKEKLKTTTFNGSKSKGKSKRRVSCTTQVAAAPAVELFEATMGLVKEASKAFTSVLLSLMRSAHWDIAAAVRSIEAASSTTNHNLTPNTTFTDSIVGANHAKYALESYVNRKIFQGFDHETFYMDGSLASILHPDQHRRDCFTQYRDMKAMDPIELLGILPTCSFGNFCFKKYLSIVHPKMEESLFGDLEQRRQVLDGHHPRSQFYGEFLRLAKAVWLLHLLAFSLDPPPGHFEASRGAEFHSQYMESVVRISGGGAKVGMAMVVGFPVSPGFKVGNGSTIKARVYLVSKN